MNRNTSVTTPYAEVCDTFATFMTPIDTYGKGSYSMDEAIPTLSAVPENPSPYITTQTNPELVAMNDEKYPGLEFLHALYLMQRQT